MRRDLKPTDLFLGKASRKWPGTFAIIAFTTFLSGCMAAAGLTGRLRPTGSTPRGDTRGCSPSAVPPEARFALALSVSSPGARQVAGSCAPTDHSGSARVSQMGPTDVSLWREHAQETSSAGEVEYGLVAWKIVFPAVASALFASWFRWRRRLAAAAVKSPPPRFQVAAKGAVGTQPAVSAGRGDWGQAGEQHRLTDPQAGPGRQAAAPRSPTVTATAHDPTVVQPPPHRTRTPTPTRAPRPTRPHSGTATPP